MDFDGLNNKFHDKLYAFIDKCNAHEIVLEFETGFVHPREQARLWRKGRSDSEIDAKIAEFQLADADYLVKLLIDAHAPEGLSLTDDLPGFTWHNWGQAYTFCILGEDGRPILSTSKIYAKAAELAKVTGLTSGYYFRPKQAYLVQMSPHKTPAAEYSLQEINKEMERMYGNNK